MSPPPPEYSHSFAQTSDEHDLESSNRLNPLGPYHDVDENADIQDEPTYPEPSPSDLIHPPDFRPFFTLVQDAETTDHHHPTIHYIFCDDDPAFLTSAILENISLQDETPSDPQNHERVIVVDVAADGKTILDAQSLTSTWQVASATLSQAPSWSEGTEARGEGSMMLTVTGMEGHRLHVPPEKKASVESMLGRVESIISGIPTRLAGLDRLVKKDVVEQEDSGAEVPSTDAAGAGDHDESAR